jgi:putative PEP-CTERM system TPR-repeat lipoprotein
MNLTFSCSPRFCTSGQAIRVSSCTRTRFRTGVGAGVTILFALLLAGCGPASLSEDQHLQRAAQFQERGELRAAAIEYRNALQLNASNAEARLALGQVSMRMGDLATARNEFTRAAALGADPFDVQAPLARLALLERDYQGALKALESLGQPKGFDADRRAALLLLEGEALAGLGRPDDASRAFKEALSLDPMLALAHVGLAAVQIGQDNPEGARANLGEALALDPGTYQAWSLLGDLEASLGQFDRAEEAFTHAIENSAVPYDFHLRRAVIRMAAGDLGGMEDDLRALRALASGAPGTSYAEGLLLYAQGQYAQAQVAFEETLGRAPDFEPAILFLGASHFAQRHWRQAEQNLTRYLRANPGSSEATRLLAAVRLEEGDAVRAEALLQPVLVVSPDDAAALALMGQVHFAQGQHDRAVEYLQRVATIRPEDTVARTALAGALLQSGQQSEGLGQLEAAVEQAPGEHALEVAYIVSLIEAARFDDALEAVSRLLEVIPKDPVPYNLRAAALIGKGQTGAAIEALRAGLQVVPGDTALSDNLARLAIQAGEPGEARRIYQEALKHNPGHLGITLRLARLEAEAGDLDTMERLLEGAVREHPGAVQPRVVLGRHYLSREEPRRALALLEPVRQTAAADVDVLDLTARAQLAAGQRAQATTTLRAFAQKVPDSGPAEVLYRLGFGFEQAGSPRDARAQYQRALEADPSHPEALQALAALESREGRRDEALALAQRMQQVEAVAGAGHLLQGRLLMADGRLEEATSALSRAVELGAGAEGTIAVAQVLQRLNRPAEAIELLETRLNQFPDETSVRFHLAQALFSAGESAAAIREYEELTLVIPDNPAVQHDLALLYQEAGDDRALEHAERAFALRPDNPAAAAALGSVLVHRGEVERGLPLLETALAALPGRADVRYHHAYGLARAGETDKARRELAALLEEVESFPQRDDAEALLETLR